MTLHLGLDLGGTNIKSCVLETVDGRRDLISQSEIPTPARAGPRAVVQALIDAAQSGGLAVDADCTVGLGVPGHFDSETGRIGIFPNLPGEWEGFPIRSAVEDGLGKPVSLINDARAFALAEGLMGAGRGHDVVVCVTLGTGIGGGILINGELFDGSSGVAGEIGHQVIDPNGPACGCGNHGCVEAMARADVLTDLAGQETVADVYSAAADGDDLALSAIETVAGYIGIGLANVITVLGPSRIVVGGGISAGGDQVIKPIEEATRAMVSLIPDTKYDIVGAELGSAAGAIGAALAGSVSSASSP
jgi:glucokinase